MSKKYMTHSGVFHNLHEKDKPHPLLVNRIDENKYEWWSTDDSPSFIRGSGLWRGLLCEKT